MNHSESFEPVAESDWPNNYFNYFTEVEEQFQRARGTGLFLMSPLDWALIENWKNSGIPLEAVLKGIDTAFEKWRSRKVKRRLINSVAYCTQAVLEAAQRAGREADRAGMSNQPPFSADDLRVHLLKALEALRARPESPFQEIVSALEPLAANSEQHIHQLEDLERLLTAMEDRIVAILRTSQSVDEVYAARQALDRELTPYRGKMTAEQLAMLEHRYLDTALLERAGIPRLSLFYLH